MPPPAVSVDSRSPSNASFNFKSQNGPSFGPPTHPNDHSCSFNTGLDPSSTSFSAGSQASSARPKPKPRLVKQRRSAKSAAVTHAHAFVDSGVNPFRSVSDNSNCCSNSDEFVSSSFVFRVSNLGNVVNCSSNNKISDDSKLARNASSFGVRDSANVDSVKNDCDLQKQEFNFSEIDKNRGINDCTEGVTFRFGAVAKDRVGVNDVKSGEKLDEFKLMDEMNKLNIDNVEKGSCREGENCHGLDTGHVSKGGDPFFVFKTGGASSGSSVPVEGDMAATNLNGSGEGKKDGLGSQDVDDVFVFGSNEKFTQRGDSSFQSTSFPAKNEGARVEEELLSSSFSFSSIDAEVGTAKPDACSSMGEKKQFSSSSMPEQSGGSFPDFELPHFDAPMSFSANISSGLGRKQESSLRHRGLKDRNLKRTKGKLKQSKNLKMQPAQIPVSSEYVTQGPEAPECYSPMDFSPYEDTSNTSVPLSDPPASAVPTDLKLNNTGTDFNQKMNGHGGDTNPLSFSSDKISRGEEKFTFTSSTSSQNHVASSKRIQRRKYRMKKPAFISADTSKVQGSSQDGTPLLSKFQGVGGNSYASVSKDKHKTEAEDELGCEAYSDAEKACEKWRRRGNEAYEKGELSKAEDFYTWGVNCVPLGNASVVTLRPLVRCYSNRAAARMALGRLREAIQDCLMAVKIDPTFHRAQIRAANCYLQLGEVEDAIQCFNKCLGSGNVVYLDRQVVISASEGIQKSQKLIECSSRSAELLKLRTSDAATDALQYISEAMTISIYSERLLELKAQALCMLSRHEEVITLCQKTLDFAERNFMDSIPGYHEVNASSSLIRLWRYHASAKCQFHLGNLEEALDLLKKREVRNKTQELSDPLAVTIHELLKQKSAGNTAFRSEKHVEAIEHYTSAIYNSMESRPFAAICFCNRAAAYQALGQITDAISDCSLAIALDENYAKAVSRRATLHEMIRDYKQAVADLQKLLSLQKQSLEKSEHSGSGKGKELRQLQQRLSVMEEEAKKDTPLDLYLILGTKKCDSISEIKKAYRKAALRHHPDKAAQSLVKSGEVGDEGRHWKDIAELVYKDSDRLFKMIGEAYAVLSDPTKREEYDLDEDMRKALKESNNNRSNSRRYSDNYNKGYPFERSSSRRYWQDSYKTYSHSHRR